MQCSGDISAIVVETTVEKVTLEVGEKKMKYVKLTEVLEHLEAALISNVVQCIVC